MFLFYARLAGGVKGSPTQTVRVTVRDTSSALDSQVELLQLLQPSGNLSSGFFEPHHPGEALMIGTKGERSSVEVWPKMLYGSYNGEQFPACYAVILLLTAKGLTIICYRAFHLILDL